MELPKTNGFKPDFPGVVVRKDFLAEFRPFFVFVKRDAWGKDFVPALFQDTFYV
jgi:hypothetical protein